MSKLPIDFERYDGENIISNFDHVIEHTVADAIKDKNLFSGYPGWNFYGKVWFENNQWHCDVWTYNSYNRTISSDSLEDLKSSVCAEYGDE